MINKTIKMKLADLLLGGKPANKLTKRQRAASKQIGFYETTRGRRPTGGPATISDKLKVALTVEILHREGGATLTADAYQNGIPTGTAFVRAMKLLRGNPHATTVQSIRAIWRQYRKQIDHF